ncbi:HET-domain-containing protein [Polychaeton citri CBS 116435]|uniref:HET-domain-containing protein n=1 Tax=Polychaeton citri CBS 116435 TaxID=1314669 RepID=A0A9P4USA9_9PEZI|nr:HET-domain-containing protein [Polychaeton citri CBS 116435]
MERYAYGALQPRHIRVLRLQPGEHASELQCHLQAFSLDNEETQYEALSYVWGPTEPSFQLRCGQGSITITRNLRGALARLRLLNKARLLWVDQVCINQENLGERASQVLLMGRIYEKATGVIMWLGEQDAVNTEFPNLASELIKKLSSIPKEVFLDEQVPADETLAARGLPPLTSPQWQAFDAFVSSSYWERCWILQEIRFARFRTIVWGDVSYDWDAILHAAVYVLHNIQLHTGTLAVVNSDGLEKIHLIPQPAEGLYQYLQISRTRKATDERDKVFSTLGMLAVPPDDIEVDYSKPIVDVFTQAAKHIMRSHDDLGQLRHAGRHNHIKGLGSANWPSWVPQWQDNEVWSLSTSDPSVSADRGTPAKFKFSDDPSPILISQGFIVDEISMVVELERLRNPEPITSDISLRVSAAWRLCRRDDTFADENGEPLIKTFLHTLLCGGYHVSKSIADTEWRPALYGDFAKFWAIQQMVQPELCRSLDELKEALEPADAAVIADDEWLPASVPLSSELWQATRHVFRVDFYAQAAADPARSANLAEQTRQLNVRLKEHWFEDEIEDVIWWILPLAYVSGNYAHFAKRYRESTYWRRFFVTREGRMGMAPELGSVGDVVAVLPGCRIPQLLRPLGDTVRYELIGECYIHGLMHGEAVCSMRKEDRLEDLIESIGIV